MWTTCCQTRSRCNSLSDDVMAGNWKGKKRLNIDVQNNAKNRWFHLDNRLCHRITLCYCTVSDLRIQRHDSVVSKQQLSAGYVTIRRYCFTPFTNAIAFTYLLFICNNNSCFLFRQNIRAARPCLISFFRWIFLKTYLAQDLCGWIQVNMRFCSMCIMYRNAKNNVFNFLVHLLQNLCTACSRCTV